jgi:KaiC/GvpD/RAD55 family RecA-like ATPase
MADRVSSVAKAMGKNCIVVMMELPAEGYFDAGAEVVASLTASSFEDVYVSFQRPCRNVLDALSRRGVDTKKLTVIDAATSFGGGRQDRACVYVPRNAAVDGLVRAIYTSLGRLGGKKRFIFIDSLTTITLHKPLSETMRFFEFLLRTVKNHEGGIILVLNVAQELAQKKFIEDVAVHADEIIGERE